MPTQHPSSPPSSPTSTATASSSAAAPSAVAASSAAALEARYAGLFGGSSSGWASGSRLAAAPPAAGIPPAVATSSTGTGAHDGELSYAGFDSVDLSSLFPGGGVDFIAGYEIDASATTQFDKFSFVM